MFHILNHLFVRTSGYKCISFESPKLVMSEDTLVGFRDRFLIDRNI
jgi:hypothetical protein